MEALVEEVAPFESATTLGCRALVEVRVSSYLACSASCQNRVDIDGSREKAIECSGRCGEQLTDRLEAIREKDGCSDIDEPGAGLATPRLYVKKSAIWSKPSIDVCWINPSTGNRSERKWVEDAVRRTWESVSNVYFRGWKECSFTQMYLKRGPIKIRIEDLGTCRHAARIRPSRPDAPDVSQLHVQEVEQGLSKHSGILHPLHRGARVRPCHRLRTRAESARHALRRATSVRAATETCSSEIGI